MSATLTCDDLNSQCFRRRLVRRPFSVRRTFVLLKTYHLRSANLFTFWNRSERCSRFRLNRLSKHAGEHSPNIAEPCRLFTVYVTVALLHVYVTGCRRHLDAVAVLRDDNADCVTNCIRIQIANHWTYSVNIHIWHPSKNQFCSSFFFIINLG